MFEPRFNPPREGLRFVGGTPDCDMWFNPTSRYLIVLIGNRDHEWAAYHMYGGHIEGTGHADENDGAPGVMQLVKEKKEELETYIRLFAPWVWEI